MEAKNICPNCCNAEMADGVCPKCGYAGGELPSQAHALPAGTMLQERYFIGKILGEGGFGITYIGYDTRLNLRVAIKEYYPRSFASRSPETHAIYSYGGNDEEIFNRCKERFMNEAKSLAVFAGEPSIVTVRDCFTQNDTAYIVMEYIDGDSLKTILRQVGRIDEKSALELILPIIKTLAKMHKDNIIHRDISPDNIMVERNGRARLIDFGSAMESKADDKSTLPVLKRSFAPPEQHEENHANHGTWTDVFAICATLYNMIEGTPPVDAIERLRSAKLKDFTAPVSERTKKAIFRGLELSIEKRTQTMDALYEQLSAQTVTGNPAPKKPVKLIAGIVGIAAVVVAVVGVPFLINNLPDEPIPPVTTTAETTTVPPETTTAATETPAPETTAPPAPGAFGEKFYTYEPPSYAGLTLDETVNYADDGRIIASSHTNKYDDYAGFVIDYIPDSYLTVSYTTDKSNAAYDGRHPMIDLSLTEDNYGRIYIGDSLDGNWDGEGYLLWDNNSPKCGWYTYNDGTPEGLGYSYNVTDMLTEQYEDGKVISEEEAALTKDENGNKVYILSEEGGLDFFVDSTTEAFRKNGVNEYFGFMKFPGSKYRGQIVGGVINGLGIYIWDNGDVLIAEFENSIDNYGYYYAASTGKSYFTKLVDGERQLLEELEGIDIDFNEFFG